MIRPVALLLALALLAGRPAAAADAMVIGLVTTLSGGGAAIGRDVLDGFTLGMKHVGGRLGGLEVEVEVADDHRDATAARQHAERLAQREHILAVVSGGAAPEIAEAMAGPVTAAGVLMINVGRIPPALAGRGCHANLYSLAGPDGVEEEALGRYLRAQGYTRPWAVLPQGKAGDDILAALQRGFGAAIGAVISPSGRMAFDAEIKALKVAGADALVLAHTGGMAAAFMRHLEAEALPLPLFGTSRTFNHTLLPALEPLAENAVVIGSWSEDVDTVLNKRVLAEFEAENGRPPSVHAIRAYEAVMLLDSAVRAVQGKLSDREGLRLALRRAEFPSVRPLPRFDQNQFLNEPLYILRLVRTPRGRLGKEMRLAYGEVRAIPGECPLKWELPPPEPPPGRKP